MPAVVEEVRRITGKEPSHNLNPDECVALGAAVQGGKLGGAIVAGSSAAEIILMDVTPLSLGIETVGGVSTKIIDRNTTIPTRYSQIFTTAGSFQTSVDIKVLQGERQFATDKERLILMQEVRLIRLCDRWKMSWLTRKKERLWTAHRKRV